MIEYDALTRNFICDFTDAPLGIYKRKVEDKWLVPEMYAYNMQIRHIKEDLINIDNEELLSNSVSVVPEEYQIIGAKWLLKSGRNLGDAMGLGNV